MTQTNLENYGEKKTAGQGEFWKPETQGDKIEGVFIGVFEGEYGKGFKLKTQDKTIVLPTLKVLESRFAEIPLQSYVWVEYLGEGEATKKGWSAPKLFNVEYAEVKKDSIEAMV